MFEGERSKCGWEILADVMEMSVRQALRFKEEMFKANVIWYDHPRDLKNKNGKPIRKPMVHFYESRVKTWLILKRAKGEMGFIPKWAKNFK